MSTDSEVSAVLQATMGILICARLLMLPVPEAGPQLW